MPSLVSPEGELKRLDRRTLLLAFVIMIPLAIWATYLHELGHVSACIAGNGLPSIQFDWLSGTGITNCEVAPDVQFDEFGYSIAGGVLSGLSVLVFPAIMKRLIGRIPKPLLIASVAIAASEFLNAILEGFATKWYLSNVQSATVALLLPSVIIFVALALLLARRHAIEPKIKKEAKQRKAEGQKEGGRGHKKLSAKFAQSKSRDIVGKALGVSGYNLEKAEKVVEDPIQKWKRRMAIANLVTAFLLGAPSPSSTSSINTGINLEGLYVKRATIVYEGVGSNAAKAKAHASASEQDNYIDRLNRLAWGAKS